MALTVAIIISHARNLAQVSSWIDERWTPVYGPITTSIGVHSIHKACYAESEYCSNCETDLHIIWSSWTLMWGANDPFLVDAFFSITRRN